ASSFAKTCFSIKSLMSRIAVSREVFVILAHLDDVSFPSKLSRSRFSIFRCLSLKEVSACRSQKSDFVNVFFKVESDAFMAFVKVVKNHFSHAVISKVPFWEDSNIL